MKSFSRFLISFLFLFLSILFNVSAIKAQNCVTLAGNITSIETGYQSSTYSVDDINWYRVDDEVAQRLETYYNGARWEFCNGNLEITLYFEGVENLSLTGHYYNNGTFEAGYSSSTSNADTQIYISGRFQGSTASATLESYHVAASVLGGQGNRQSRGGTNYMYADFQIEYVDWRGITQLDSSDNSLTGREGAAVIASAFPNYRNVTAGSSPDQCGNPDYWHMTAGYDYWDQMLGMWMTNFSDFVLRNNYNGTWTVWVGQTC